MTKPEVDLLELFTGLQDQMITRLTTNRSIISHPGEKGTATELCWGDLLRDYLPKRYQISKGFVVDSKGQISDQIDLIIYDRQYSPFLFNQDDVFFALWTIRKNL